MKFSLSESTGISTGMPPAWSTPFFTFSASTLKCRWHGIDLAPRIEDRDDRLARPILRPEPHLPRARAVAEGAQIIRTKPAEAAELFGSEAGVQN